MKKVHVLSGIDNLSLADSVLLGKRIGLMTNPTGIDHSLQSTIDLLASRYRLTALFAVEHGIRGDLQAGEKVDSAVDPDTGIPVFSAYGAASRFTDQMLSAFDVLVFDIQDVGARFYTYLYSLAYAMQACDRAGKALVVLDRINPLGGLRLSGTVLDPRFASFVGDYELPTQYALTIGEFARYVRDYLDLSLSLTVVPLQGWRRSMRLDDTDLPWVAPSPNCPDLDAALCYIGTCIFEGTNISEGRGTTQPFRLIGAPWLDAGRLEKRMAGVNTPGIHFRRASFRPTFSKHQGELCGGVQMHILDRDQADVFTAALLLMDEIRSLSGTAFQFLSHDGGHTFFIDKLLGTDAWRTGRLSSQELTAASREPLAAFARRTLPFRLYD